MRDRDGPEVTAQDLAMAISDDTKRGSRVGGYAGKIRQLYMVKSDLA